MAESRQSRLVNERPQHGPLRSCGKTAVAENQVVIASSVAEASSTSACLLPGVGPGEEASEAGRCPAPAGTLTGCSWPAEVTAPLRPPSGTAPAWRNGCMTETLKHALLR